MKKNFTGINKSIYSTIINIITNKRNITERKDPLKSIERDMKSTIKTLSQKEKKSLDNECKKNYP